MWTDLSSPGEELVEFGLDARLLLRIVHEAPERLLRELRAQTLGHGLVRAQHTLKQRRVRPIRL